MSKDFPHEKLLNSNSPVNQSPEEEQEEALSLSDLPIDKANQSRKEEAQATEPQDQFDFGFGSSGGLASTESQMCAADEVFFKGQILPFRYSISSDSGIPGFLNPSRCVSRSESMDHSYSGGVRSVINSRSSSIKSQYSSSSGSSTTTTTRTGYKPKVRNQFHSHPSPSPQIRSRSVRQGNAGHRNPKSTIWGFFQTGLIRTPPEIGLSSSIRGNNKINKSFGSRNSNSSSCSTVSNEKKVERKKKQRLFDINGALFGDCKCSVEIVPSKIVIVNEEEREKEKEKEKRREKEGKQKQKRKQAVSRNRTFEWLKQLSLEGTTDGA